MGWEALGVMWVRLAARRPVATGQAQQTSVADCLATCVFLWGPMLVPCGLVAVAPTYGHPIVSLITQ